MSSEVDLCKLSKYERPTKDKNDKLITCVYCKKKATIGKIVRISNKENYLCSDYCWDKWLNSKINWLRF